MNLLYGIGPWWIVKLLLCSVLCDTVCCECCVHISASPKLQFFVKKIFCISTSLKHVKHLLTQAIWFSDLKKTHSWLWCYWKSFQAVTSQLVVWCINASSCMVCATHLNTTVQFSNFSFLTRCGSSENEKGGWIIDGSQWREGTFDKLWCRTKLFSSCLKKLALLSLFLFSLNCLLQDRKIDELKQSLLRYKKVQDMVMSVQGKKG